jgi:PKD repeat protein
VDWSFSADNRSDPVYYTSDNNLALGTQWRGYGRMVFGLSDLFDDEVMGRGSNQDLASLVIGYLSRNMKPALDYSVDPPEVVEVGEPVVLDMSGSSDPDGEIVTYSVLIGGNEFMEGPDPVMEYTFSESGVFPAVLTVTDNEGGETSVTISIRSNRPPSEGIGVTKTEAYAGEEILFDYKGSDPDGDEVTVLWDFGDGSIRNGRTVSYQYNNKGMYEVTVTVRDSAGMEINMTRNILIKNSDPEAEMDKDGIQVNNGAPTFTGDMRVTLELFEGDQILISGAPSDDPDRGDSLNYTWSLDGGVIGEGVILEYRFRESGLHTLNLTVDDGYGGVGQDQLTVMVFNNPPTAFAEARVDGNKVIFDASASSDDSWDSDLTYVWDFGDGEEKETRDPSVEHRYRFGGTYTVNLTVVDPDGDKGYYTLKVRPDGMRLLDWIIIAAVILVMVGVVVAGILVYLRKGASFGDVEARVFSGSSEDEGGEPEIRGFSNPVREHRARSIKDLGDEGSKD